MNRYCTVSRRKKHGLPYFTFLEHHLSIPRATLIHAVVRRWCYRPEGCEKFSRNTHSINHSKYITYKFHVYDQTQCTLPQIFHPLTSTQVQYSMRHRQVHPRSEELRQVELSKLRIKIIALLETGLAAEPR